MLLLCVLMDLKNGLAPKIRELRGISSSLGIAEFYNECVTHYCLAGSRIYLNFVCMLVLKTLCLIYQYLVRLYANVCVSHTEVKFSTSFTKVSETLIYFIGICWSPMKYKAHTRHSSFVFNDIHKTL